MLSDGFLAVSSEIKLKLRLAAIGSCRRACACEHLPLALPKTPQTALFRATDLYLRRACCSRTPAVLPVLDEMPLL